MRASTSPSTAVTRVRRATTTMRSSSTMRASSTSQKVPITVERQRAKAKDMVQYFRKRAYEEDVENSTTFGWTADNEINNGRWTMFGLLVGMMTELATGVDFPDQIRLMISVLGVADVYE
jgi:hypothetical protein